MPRRDDHAVSNLYVFSPGRPAPAVTRWGFTTLAVLVLLACAAGAAGRLVGRRPGAGSPALVTVVSSWLGAYVLWTFVGGLLLEYGALSIYDGGLFGLVALVAGALHYRVHRRAGREQGLAVFVGGQLLWLAVVLVRNGWLVS
jgi:hypothetical protein